MKREKEGAKDILWHTSVAISVVWLFPEEN
jgi:hypothetical protein